MSTQYSEKEYLSRWRMIAESWLNENWLQFSTKPQFRHVVVMFASFNNRKGFLDLITPGVSAHNAHNLSKRIQDVEIASSFLAATISDHFRTALKTFHCFRLRIP